MPTFTPPFSSILRLAALFVALLAFASTGFSQETIVGWDFNGLSGYGSSPQAPTTTATNVTAVGLTRSGFATTGTAGANAWGGVGNGNATFTVKANAGYTLSLNQISAYNVRRSSLGATTGQWAYSLDGTTFTGIGSAITWGSTTTSSGNAQGAITLSDIPALQNLPSTTTVTFRVSVSGGTTGTWYLNNFQTGNDFVVTGATTLVGGEPAITISPATLSSFSYVVDEGPSAAQSFSLSASDLNSPAATVTLNATGTAYQLSSNNSTFSDTLTLTASGGAIPATTLYVRLRAGQSAATYNQTIPISGGGASTSLGVNGAVSGLDFTPITAVGTPVSQNFDSMGNSTTLPNAWKMHASTSSPTWSGAGSTVTQASSGLPSPTAGGTYNWGNTAGTDRSVGAMTSGSFASPNNLLAKLRNNTGSTLTNLSIDFQVERYRVNTAAASVELYYSTDGTNWSAIAGGDVPGADLPPGTSAYDFTPGLTVTRTGVVQSGLSIANGSDFYLRWNINTTGSNSQGIGIDDISITASGGGTPPAPAITSATTASATVGAPFTYTITASNTPTSFGATGLPAGLTVNSTTGAITGTPTTAGTTNATITATNSGGTGNATLAFTIAQGTPIITTPPTASAINAGQTLADSNLTGGNASVAGTFTFATPSFVPSATGSQLVVFTPTDAANYTTANTSVTVTVNPGQDSTFDTWTGGNVTMTPAILQTYAIGGGNYNGTVAPQTPVTTVSGGNLTLTAIVRTDDPALTVIGEHKTDLTLGTWTSLGNGTATVDQSGVPSGCERRAFSTPADGTKKFLRLRAVYNAN